MSIAKVLYFSGEIPQGDPRGDQYELFRKFRLLAKERRYPILASFLEVATTTLHSECNRLNRDRRPAVPPFESILDLTEYVVEMRKTPLGGAIERVLSVVYQLGCFIAYHECHPLEYDFEVSDTFLIGRGPGLLSAAAIGLSPRISMIPDVAECIIQVAFRFGVVVDQVCRSLEVSPDEISADGAWVYCVFTTDIPGAQEALEQFHSEKRLPDVSRASIFNTDENSISISGPPSTLKGLLAESEFFKDSRRVPLRKIQGLWHTDKAYGPEHVQQALPHIEKEHKMCLRLFSPVTGRPFELGYAKPLLNNVMEEILTQNVHWDQTIETVSKQLQELAPKTVEIISAQPSHYVETLLETWRTQLPGAVSRAKDIVSATMNAPLHTSRPRDAKSSKIAVVGMACRFPGGADNTEKFWELLEQGVDTHQNVPPDRFCAETHVDPTGQKRNTSKTPYGCFVQNPAEFDAPFFNMNPREAEQTDPMQRLALVTAYEALEHAGFVHGRGVHARRVGTFYGQASDDYREVNSGQEVGTYYITGGCRAFGPGRINYIFDFWGPSFSVDTACSSSAAAIQAACTSLWSGDVDMALAGGMNILTNSDVYAGLSSAHFLSSTGNCKTWDSDADGYCRSDGVGTVVLKRLEDAEADNDNILAVVLSAATDHSAEACSITHPHDGAQAHLFTQVARRAGVDPLSVGYVEMHGTGTQAGDKVEMTSVTSVFAPENRRKDPLYVGTVKSNFGHGEAAAGIMAFVKTLLVFHKGIMPPHIGIKTGLNPNLPDLTKRNVVIPYEAKNWKSEGSSRLAMVNNFGAAGGNTSIILQEANPRPRLGCDDRPHQVLMVSAKSTSSLHENLKRLVEFMQSNEVSLADLSYTLSARKSHYRCRVAITAESVTEAVDQLKPHIESSLEQKRLSGKKSSIAFAFTGQGTLYVGIGKELYWHIESFRQHLAHLDGLARRQKFETFLPVIEGTCEVDEISTVTIHLSIVCVEIALAQLWKTFNVTPSLVIGHSLGEYAALVVAGVLSEAAAVFLVGTRAHLIDSKCEPGTHGMMSVVASAACVQEAARGLLIEICCVNGPQETVVGGPSAELDRLAAIMIEAGHKTFRLPVPHAYHTHQMDTILEEFVDCTRGIVYKKPRIPIASPRYAQILGSSDPIDVHYLAGGTRAQVDFAGALDHAWDTGAISDSTLWIEMGHHSTLCGFIKRTLPSTRLALPSLHRGQNSWTTMSKSACALYNAGVDLDWNAYHLPFEQSLRLIETPTYAWDNKNFWLQYRGDWNLTKGSVEMETKPAVARFSTSSIHQILSEEYTGKFAEVRAETSITSPSLQDVVDGHAMNGHSVASSFLHADMAFTLCKHISDKALPNSMSRGINVRDFEYHHPVVKQLEIKDRQPIFTTASADLAKMEVEVKWYNPANETWYCHAKVTYEDTLSWLSEWSPFSRLVTSHMESLQAKVAAGTVEQMTTDRAYSLFGKLVDYSSMYRTMQSVILDKDEAMADVVYPRDTGGTWTVPPHFIDGCISLSGFVLNGGTHFENDKDFYITPEWKSMRFAKPLVPGGRYKAYTQMVHEKANRYVGNVYILEESQIVGVVEAFVFLKFSRALLPRFFTPPDAPNQGTGERIARSKTIPSAATDDDPIQAKPRINGAQSSDTLAIPILPNNKNRQDSAYQSGSDIEQVDTVTHRGLFVIAEELRVDVGELSDEIALADVGIDSLMSLTLAAKLREECSVEMRDDFFLEVETFGELKKLLR